MYLPKHFEETGDSELHRLITAHPFGIFIFNSLGRIDANHLPFELDMTVGDRGHLLTHVARANSIWKDVQDSQDILVIFRGPDAYISPNWYPSKHRFHKQVPTWNYQVVHVYGKATVCDNKKFVRGVVARLTRIHEADTRSERPWKMSDAPVEYIDKMLDAIVGIDIEITEVIGKWKLSQNKTHHDRASAAEKLHQQGNPEMADAMLRADSSKD